jgi:outer membrane receptor protein involved in Fe transport
MAITAALFSLCLFAHAEAQVTGAVIQGIITDPQGAAIPGVEVTVVNTATKVTTTTSTNDTGLYEFPPLIPGPYELTASETGFDVHIRKGIQLVLQQRLRIDIVMQVSSVLGTVEVHGNPTLVDTESGKASHLVSGETIADLPLNGRNSYMITRLVPGTNTTSAAEGLINSFDTFTPSNVSINGAPVQSNSVLLDGVVNQFGNGALGFAPSTEAIKETTIQTFALSAEYGQSAGSVVTMESKSGTNDFHGSLYYFHNDKSLNANDFFGNKFGSPRAPNIINQYGGTVGGPIYLPRFSEGKRPVYSGKNRSFFFFNYEGIRERFGYRSLNSVPTALERQGDFSKTLAANGQLIQIYNPFTTRPDPTRPGQFIRDPFANNVIPQALISPIAQNVLKYVPLPNLPGSVNNFLFTSAYTENSDSYHLRIDHQLTSNDTLYSTYGQIKRVEFFLSNLPTGVTGWVYSTDSKIWTLGLTHVFNSTTVLNVRAGLPYTGQSVVPHTTIADRQGLGFPQSFTSSLAAPSADFPSFSNSDMTGFGQGTSVWTFYTPDITTFISKVAGRHSLSSGYEFRLFRANVRTSGGEAGSFSFNRGFTQGPNPNTSGANAGYGVASLLLGTPSSGSVNINANSAGQTGYHALYIQDSWRVRNRLTLNLGLRYDYETPVTERYNRMTRGFDYSAASPVEPAAAARYALNPIPQLSSLSVKGGLRFVAEGGQSRYNFDPSKDNFMPRVGAAFQLTPKTVLRGGYGLFYIPLREMRGFGVGQANLPMSQAGFSSSTAMLTSLDGGLTPFNTLGNPFPQGFVQPVGSSLGLATLLGQSVSVYDEQARRASSQEFQLSVQRELPGQILLDVAYVGSRVKHLPVDENINGIPPQYLSLGNALNNQVPNPFFGLIQTGTLSQPTVARSQLLRQYPQFTGVTVNFRPIGHTQYDSLQVSANRRYSSGFSILGSYTWSRSMQDLTFLNFGFPLEHVISPLDRPHRLVVSGLWDIPLGKERRLGKSLPRPLLQVIGDWNLSWIVTFQSGQPVSGWGGAVLIRPLQHVESSLDKWFDTGAFAPQPAFTLRSVSSLISQIRADGTQRVDLTLGKQFRLPWREGMHVELQGRFFNLLNTPQFAAPNTSVTSSAFGTVTSQANQPRNIQVALRIVF